MNSFEAMRRCISGRTRRLARRLRLSPSLVGKWQEPTGGTFSGCLNPLDRVKECIDEAIASGVPEEEALAPVDYLCETYRRVAVPVIGKNSMEHGAWSKGSKEQRGESAESEDLTRELARTISEFGKLTTEASEAIGGGRVRKLHVLKIGRHAWRAARQALLFLFKVEKAAASSREAA
jgi:hypothetical protein